MFGSDRLYDLTSQQTKLAEIKLLRQTSLSSFAICNSVTSMCELIKRKYACGCEKPIFRNTICRHNSSVDARLCKLMTIETKVYNEKCMVCRLKDSLRRFASLKKKSKEAENGDEVKGT